MTTPTFPSLALVALCAFALSACKKEQPPSPEPEPTSEREQAEDEAPQAAEAEAEGSADEEAQLVIDEDVVNRYLAMWSQEIELVRRVVSEVDQTLAEMKEKGELSGTLHALRRGQEIEDRLDKDEAKLRREFRFTEQQVERLQDFFGQIATSVQVARAVPAEKLIADMRAQLAKLPEAERAGAMKEIDQMEADFKAQRELKDLRAEFGDAAVTAALEHEEQIIELQARQLEILKDY